jgi:hypothetical protein
MNDVNTDSNESDGSAESKGADEGKADEGKETAAAAPPEEEKRTARRKPIWVCIPVEWEEVADVDEATGDMISRNEPTKYTITQCEPKKKVVLEVLARNDIDITNIGTVIMFRADPLDFGVTNQLDIRW